jgi:HEPN domain-containing protein
MCTLRSAECVEFSVKAILIMVVGDYKRDHDVSGDLITVYDKFPVWFKVKVPRISFISGLFTFISLTAKYGNEFLKISPKKIFERTEAEAFRNVAREVYLDCNRLFHEIKSRPS